MFSLFTRLYVGLVTGLALTVALFLFMGEEYMRKTEVGVFLSDGAYFVDQYIEQRGTPDSLYKKLTENGKQDFFIFDLTLVENWDGSPPCRDCIYTDSTFGCCVQFRHYGLHTCTTS
ncbi:hypothetical protein C408_3395 [Vibrio diabolicus E0666]|nr:hypothetical protein C408_3395 [Vibrio diabolicus E0666]